MPIDNNGQDTGQDDVLPAETDKDVDLNDGTSGEDDGPTSMFDAMDQGLKEAFGDGEDGEQEQDQEKDGGDPPKPEEEAAKDGDKNKGDDDVEIPEDIQNPKSRERFREMATNIKTLSQENEQLKQQVEPLKQDVEGLRTVIQESQATPEEFAQLIDYSKKLKTGDLEGAFEIVSAQYNQLSRLLGRTAEPAGGTQAIYAEHQDLQAAVDNMEMSEEWANQVAAQRNREHLAQQQAQQTQAAQQQHQQQSAAIDQARARITELGKQWRANDIDYAAKHELIMQRIPQIAQAYPPHFWEQALTDYYNSLSHVKGQAEPQPKPKTPAPLRPNGAGGGKPEPKSVHDAVEAALGGMTQ